MMEQGTFPAKLLRWKVCIRRGKERKVLGPGSLLVSVHVGLHAGTNLAMAPLPDEAMFLFHIRVLHIAIHAQITI